MKNMVNDTILYESIEKIALRSKRPFWKAVFHSLARGRSPSGCYVSNSYLTCGLRGKEFVYKFEDCEKSSEVIEREIISILQTRLNLLSSSDRLKKVEKFHELKEKIKHDIITSSWSDIRRKNVKNLFLEIFVISLHERGDIEECSMKKVLAILTIAIIFKHVTNDDIVFEEGRIREIKPWNDGKLRRSSTKKKCPRVAQTDAVKKTTLELWKKFIRF